MQADLGYEGFLLPGVVDGPSRFVASLPVSLVPFLFPESAEEYRRAADADAEVGRLATEAYCPGADHQEAVLAWRSCLVSGGGSPAGLMGVSLVGYSPTALPLQQSGPPPSGSLVLPFGTRLLPLGNLALLDALREVARQPDMATRRLVGVLLHGIPATAMRRTLVGWPNATSALLDGPKPRRAPRDEEPRRRGRKPRPRSPYVAADLALRIERSSDFLRDRVGRRRQVSLVEGQVMTLTSLCNAVLCFVWGIAGGLARSAGSPSSGLSAMTEGEFGHLVRVAGVWFSALFEILGPELADREGSVASWPAVFPSLGAVGHVLLTIPEDAVAARASDLAAGLCEVDWRRGPAWDGVAGRLVAPVGGGEERLRPSGPKELGYACYRALTAPAERAYQMIRAARR